MIFVWASRERKTKILERKPWPPNLQCLGSRSLDSGDLYFHHKKVDQGVVHFASPFLHQSNVGGVCNDTSTITTLLSTCQTHTTTVLPFPSLFY
jgi:hypothetical protein